MILSQLVMSLIVELALGPDSASVRENNFCARVVTRSDCLTVHRASTEPKVLTLGPVTGAADFDNVMNVIISLPEEGWCSARTSQRQPVRQFNTCPDQASNNRSELGVRPDHNGFDSFLRRAAACIRGIAARQSSAQSRSSLSNRRIYRVRND